MFKLSERRRRHQAQQIEAKFRRVLVEMRRLGEKAGGFVEASRAEGQTFTAAQLERAAQAMADEASASAAAPLASLQASGVKVSLDLDQAALRSEFLAGLYSTLGAAAVVMEGTA